MRLRGGLESSRMKRCRTCNRTYTDPTLSFCNDDGTPLTTEVDDAPYRPPSAYVPPRTATPQGQRRARVWIVGLLGAFVLGAVGLTIALAIFGTRMTGSRQAPPPVATTDESENVDAPPPTDAEQVKAQLLDLENEWEAANINADKKALERILADDFVGSYSEGGLQGKRDYLNSIERDVSIERWEFSDLKVQLSGNRATLSGNLTLFGGGQQLPLQFVDKYVWRKGRWQAIGSDVKKRE